MLRSVQPPAGARLIVVGDIHGCYDELVELLARIAPADRDVVVSAGDVVRKGPAAARCLDLWRERGFLGVRGNNEIKLLRRAKPLLRYLLRDTRDVARRGDLLRYIASWPLALDFPDQNVTVVHGGFLPQMTVSAADIEREKKIVHRLRWIRKTKGEWIYVPKDEQKSGDVLWAEKWRGPRLVLYGHTPVRKPKFDKYALGLDTGCVYGGALTAAILANGEWTTVSVRAKRSYV